MAGFIAGSRGAGRAESQSGNWQVNCLARVGWGGSRDGVVGFLGDSAGGLASRSCLVGAARRGGFRFASRVPSAVTHAGGVAVFGWDMIRGRGGTRERVGVGAWSRGCCVPRVRGVGERDRVIVSWLAADQAEGSVRAS